MLPSAALAGTGAPIAVGWLSGTALGAAAVSVLPAPQALGFDLMLPCFAAGMMTAMVKAKADLLPVLVGAGVALGIFHLFGPGPAIIGAGLAGAAAAAALHREAP